MDVSFNFDYEYLAKLFEILKNAVETNNLKIIKKSLEEFLELETVQRKLSTTEVDTGLKDIITKDGNFAPKTTAEDLYKMYSTLQIRERFTYENIVSEIKDPSESIKKLQTAMGLVCYDYDGHYYLRQGSRDLYNNIRNDLLISYMECLVMDNLKARLTDAKSLISWTNLRSVIKDNSGKLNDIFLECKKVSSKSVTVQ